MPRIAWITFFFARKFLEDKNLDALFVDHQMQQVVAVQGKYRTNLLKHTENRNDLIAFANLGATLYGAKKDLDPFLEGLPSSLQDRVIDANNCLIKRKYDII